MIKHSLNMVVADGGLGSGGRDSDWDYLKRCDSSFVEPDRYTHLTEEVTCPECLNVLEREAREKLRWIAAGREARNARAGRKHMVKLVTRPGDDGRYGPYFVNKCNPDFGSDWTFDIEKVTCPVCLDMLEGEAREQLRRLHVARERVRQMEIAADLAAATPRTLGEWLWAMMEVARTWWADRPGSP